MHPFIFLLSFDRYICHGAYCLNRCFFFGEDRDACVLCYGYAMLIACNVLPRSDSYTALLLQNPLDTLNPPLILQLLAPKKKTMITKLHTTTTLQPNQRTSIHPCSRYLDPGSRIPNFFNPNATPRDLSSQTFPAAPTSNHRYGIDRCG